MVDDSARAFERVFVPNKKVKIQGSIELINYQPTEIIKLESKRVWMTDVYIGEFFNKFITGEIKNEFVKRVIVNGMTGSSWRFKRFARVSIAITDFNKKIYCL